MIKYLTYYYKAGTTPFRSLSTLPETEAIQIMKELYVDDAIWGRFNNPVWYIRARGNRTVVTARIYIKRRRPQEKYPIYMVVGRCDLLEKAVPDEQLAKIQIPISCFKEEDVSFTYITVCFHIN